MSPEEVTWLKSPQKLSRYFFCFLALYITKDFFPLKPFGFHYWLGLNDIVEEGVWVWQNSFEEAGYTNWDVGEPHGDSDCAMLVESFFKKCPEEGYVIDF